MNIINTSLCDVIIDVTWLASVIEGGVSETKSVF